MIILLITYGWVINFLYWATLDDIMLRHLFAGGIIEHIDSFDECKTRLDFDKYIMLHVASVEYYRLRKRNTSII